MLTLYYYIKMETNYFLVARYVVKSAMNHAHVVGCSGGIHVLTSDLQSNRQTATRLARMVAVWALLAGDTPLQLCGSFLGD